MMQRIRNFCSFVIILFYLINLTSCSNILILYAHDSLSHVTTMAPYFKTLGAAGHNVTVLQTSSSAEPKKFGSNINTEVWQVKSNNHLLKKALKNIWMANSNGIELIWLMEMNEGILGEHLIYHSEQLKNIINKKWDLLIVDALFTNHGFAISSFLKNNYEIPYIIFDTSFVFEFQRWIYGYGGSWASQPSLMQNIPKNKDDVYKSTLFIHRALNYLQPLLSVMALVKQDCFNVYKNITKLGVTNFTLTKFTRESAAIISDGFINFEQHVPLTKRILFAGAYCGEAKPLPNDLLEFVEDKRSKGTIYVAFGSMVTYESAPEMVTDALFGALNSLTDYRIIFAFRSETKTPIFKKHIKLIKWAPQYDVLSHHKTKLFVSHGGLKSTKEAICSGRPFTFMPIFAEQPHNARVAAALGLATIINKFEITKENVLDAILQVVENKDYAKRMAKFRSIYLNQNPIAPLDEARLFTERVIRKKGKCLRHKFVGETLNSVQFFNIDIFILAIVAICIVLKK